ncbi:MAG: hypothetical protein LAO05_09345 [Acidobacteriia bacterium]|nr:hypothetical protein [Terriglobia bacterium]
MKRLMIGLLGVVFASSWASAQFVQQGEKLVGTGAVGTAAQGVSIALSADGNTAIVGGWTDNDLTGGAWVYTRSGTQWSQQGPKLVGTGAIGPAGQGFSVAISADGNTAIVGGWTDNAFVGAAWVFTRSGGVWSQQGGKLAGTGVAGTPNQGWSVALSADGNTALVGGPSAIAESASDPGAAWVFTRRGSVWSQQGSRLIGAGAVGASALGVSVSLSADGNTAVVGGPGADDGAGAAWVFTRSGAVWSQQGARLVGSGATGLANQGMSVSLSADGNTVLVGGPGDNQVGAEAWNGAVWVFTRSGAVWSQQGDKLAGTDAVGGAAQGISVSLAADGTTAVIGGYDDNSDAGAAWVFTSAGGVWSQEGAKLVGTGAVGASQQGWSVAFAGDGRTAIVGGSGDDDGAGAAWVYVTGGCQAPEVTAQPQGQIIQSGQTATLSVSAVGTPPLSYQWYEGSSGDTSHAVGVGASSFTTPALTSTTSYWVRVSNPCGHADSATATVTVGCTSPSITTQPQSQTVQSGQTAVLSVSAAGDGPLSYQWYQGTSGDTSHPVGNNASSFTTPALTTTTSYWVRVSNTCGSADSATATVTVVSASGLVVWVPVVAHNPGKNESQWRSDLGLLNMGATTANVQLSFHGPGGVVTSTSYVPAGSQSILADVVGQLGVSGQGALEVVSDQPLQLTARTYNQVAASQSCYPNGTQGQDYPALTPSDGLSAGQSAVLAGLSESAAYRANIGLVNTGSSAAEATVELYDGAGTRLTSYAVSLGPGEWKQETQPFRNKAGQRAMDRGYAKVTVQAGSGVFAFASVTDNITNDPTTVTMASQGFRQQGTKLVGTHADTHYRQGSSVALSADGTTAIVGGPNWGGAAWVFTRSGGAWTQQGEKLVGNSGGFKGWSVALSADGNTAIVGGPSDDFVTGAAYVFTRSGGVWTQQGEKLVGTGSVGDAWQGFSVALSADGNTAIVGGPSDDSNTGAAWVFTRSDGVWTQQGGKLVGTGAVAGPLGTGIGQGHSVDVSADGNTAIVGGPYGDGGAGAVWVFTRSGGVWTQQGGKLVGEAIWNGLSVALSADAATAVVGCSNKTLVFARSGGLWTQQGEPLVGTGMVGSSQQGFSVGVSGDGNTAIVSRPWDNGAVGAAWVFTRSNGVWTQQGDKLIGTGAVGGAYQGHGVALSADGDTAILGGPWDDSQTGAAWVFTRPGNDLWVPVVAHNPGKNESQWRSDLGLLNTGTSAANVQLTFHGTGGVVMNTTSVPAGSQSIVVDVVGQLGVSGQGALEVVSDQPLQLTARTYNQVAPTQSCYPNGTQGQDYPALTPSDGLSAGQSAVLAGLSESAAYRANIGLVNTGSSAAEATVELYDGAGTRLTSYAVSLGPGEWKQETQPFRNKAGQRAMDRGYAKVIVTSGTGVAPFASVTDNITNDPTTVAAQRL